VWLFIFFLKLQKTRSENKQEVESIAAEIKHTKLLLKTHQQQVIVPLYSQMVRLRKQGIFARKG
jgi:hypothetical protein